MSTSWTFTMNFQGYESEDDSAIEKQIKIDLLRTMPTHSDFLELDKGKVNFYE